MAKPSQQRKDMLALVAPINVMKKSLGKIYIKNKFIFDLPFVERQPFSSSPASSFEISTWPRKVNIRNRLKSNQIWIDIL